MWKHRMSPPRPKKGQVGQPVESDTEDSIISDQQIEDERIALRQHIAR